MASDQNLGELLLETGENDEQHSEPRNDAEQRSEIRYDAEQHLELRDDGEQHVKLRNRAKFIVAERALQVCHLMPSPTSPGPAAVVKWWEAMVKMAHARHVALREGLDRPAHRDVNRKFPEQLRVGIAVHLATGDGVCTDDDDDKDKKCELRFPRITRTHSDSLEEVKDETRVAKPTKIGDDGDKKWKFPHRLPVEDAWRVMDHYDATNPKKKRWRYHPGDVVEVRGLDMRWHMGVVTFARGFQDESRWGVVRSRRQRSSVEGVVRDANAMRKESQSEAEENDNKDDDGDEQDELVNVVRPNDYIDIGNDENEVRVPADAVRLLFGRTPFLWQQV